MTCKFPQRVIQASGNKIHLPLNKFLELQKDLIRLLKNTICKHLFCVPHLHWCSGMNIGETWSSSLPSTWSKEDHQYFWGKVDLARSLFDKQHDLNGTLLEVNKIQFITIIYQQSSHLGCHTMLCRHGRKCQQKFA